MARTGDRPPILRSWWWRESGRFVAGQARYAARSIVIPPLRWLVIGYFGYCLARKAMRVVVVVYAFDLAGVQGAAAVAVAQLLPAIVVAPLGSAFADRFDRARALAAAYVGQGVFLAVTGLTMQVGGSLALVAVFSAAASAAFAITRPVYLATLPDVVDYPDELTLGNAASAWVDGIASVIGPLLAGIGLIVVGAGEVMLGLAVVVLLAAMASLTLVIHRHVRGAHIPVRELLLGGFAVLRRDRQVAGLVGLSALQYMVVGLLDVLIVVFAVEVIGQESATAGLLAAAIGVGSTMGGMGSVLLAGRPALGPAVVAGALVTGIPIMALGVGPGLLVASALLIGYGVGKSVVTVSSQTLLQRTITDASIARVFGVQESLIQAGTAAGAALGPALVLVVGPKGALVATGLLLPVGALASRSLLRRLDRRAYVPSAVFGLLRKVDFLRVLPLRNLEQLSRQANVVHVGAGSPVIEEGHVGDRYYVIESGCVDVMSRGQHVRTLGAGSGFGEIALLRDVPRTATVIAQSDVDLVTIEREPFLEAVTGTEPSREAAHQTAGEHLDADDERARRDD